MLRAYKQAVTNYGSVDPGCVSTCSSTACESAVAGLDPGTAQSAVYTRCWNVWIANREVFQSLLVMAVQRKQLCARAAKCFHAGSLFNALLHFAD